MGKFISFEDVEELATIDQLAHMLNLAVKQSGKQLRCSCPVHGGDDRTLAISPDVRSRRGAGPEGVFFCQSSKSGGDRIGLVAHIMQIGQQDAAYFIQQQFGTEPTSTVNSTSNSNSTVSKERATLPQRTEGRANAPQPKKAVSFDPAKFEASLEYNETVKALGYTESEARAFRIGAHRGHVYFPNVYASGVIAGWSKLVDGTLVAPKTWLADTGNVVAFPKRA